MHCVLLEYKHVDYEGVVDMGVVFVPGVHYEELADMHTVCESSLDLLQLVRRWRVKGTECLGTIVETTYDISSATTSGLLLLLFFCSFLGCVNFLFHYNKQLLLVL